MLANCLLLFLRGYIKRHSRLLYQLLAAGTNIIKVIVSLKSFFEFGNTLSKGYALAVLVICKEISNYVTNKNYRDWQEYNPWCHLQDGERCVATDGEI